ncbi:MAG: insulinase family protein, partial [Butyricicoccus sp.]|nr:insulinase family protein [Butyricicoccus sp.]
MYQKITLPNGVRVVHEYIDSVRSAAIGVWVGNGSRYEPAELAGISHFIEHMIFKGTEKRTARHIAVAMDAMGGQGNAFTSKEVTCYYMRVLDTHVQNAADLLADMFLHSKFDQADLELERGVVLEEIDMYEDSPEDVATEKLFETCFDGSALGRPILGYEETLEKMTSQTLHDFVHEYYRPEDTIIAISGHYSQDDIDFICELFSQMKGTGRNVITPAVYQPSVVIRPKEIEQNHLCIGFPGLATTDERRYAYRLLSSMIGDGMSSRLFQTVREQNGLCYSVYSYIASHAETGMFSVYVGLNKEQEQRAAALVREVLEDFCANGPTRDELSRCREQ